jgi:hypothetical protein
MTKNIKDIGKYSASSILFKIIIFAIIVVFLVGVFTSNLYEFQSPSGQKFKGGILSCLMNDSNCYKILNVDIINKTIYGWILGLSLASVLFLIFVLFGKSTYVGILAASILMAIVVYLCACVITVSEIVSTYSDLNSILSVASDIQAIYPTIINIQNTINGTLQQNQELIAQLQNPELLQNIYNIHNFVSNINLSFKYPSISWYESYSLILIISAFIALLIILIVMTIIKFSKIFI